MINVYFKRENKVIVEVNIKGHADFEVYGKDIVCAGVSSSLITTVNACLLFQSDSIEFNESNNFYLKNIKKDEITNKLLDNLYNMLKEIEKKYKNNIEIKED